MSHHLIVTGDDYGLCASVNEAIEECLSAGTMRAACVMANMPAWAAAVQLRRRFPDCSIGIHWNLTQGEAVLPASRIRTLVDPKGQFLPSFRRRWLTGKIARAQVKAELRAQFNRFCEVAGAPDFWNTHQNIHVLPGMFRACVELGKELKIPAMRSHRRFTVPLATSSERYHLHHPMYWLKGKIIAHWSKQAAKQTLMPDGRIYMPGYPIGWPSLAEVLKRLPWSKAPNGVELVIHPASRVEPELFGMLTRSRVREYELFRSPDLKKRLLEMSVRPVGFEVLNQKEPREARKKLEIAVRQAQEEGIKT
ncbi:MAG TPA: ChbG/HpnK family deacetylase [Terriglobales bacterium]|nr:ChbG/HpnK family deacetylase [Terriglobales bacterium]